MQDEGKMDAIMQKLQGFPPEEKQRIMAAHGGAYDLLRSVFQTEAIKWVQNKQRAEMAQRNKPGVQVGIPAAGPMMPYPQQTGSGPVSSGQMGFQPSASRQQ
jgi:hypothetical protein